MQIGIFTLRPELMQQLETVLLGFGQSSYLDLQIHRFDGLQALFASLVDVPLDLLLFDMEDSENVKDELVRITQTIPNCILILLCNDTRYALFGYTLRAKDYLTTPLNQEDLIDVLTRSLRERLEGKEQYLPLKLNGIWSRLNMRHITYLESAGHNLIFHMNDGRAFRTNSSFSDYQTLLDMNRDFFRCHKSYVVNMRYVTGWDPNNLTLYDGRTINISRSYRQAVRSYYVCYVTQSWDMPQHASTSSEKGEQG